MYLYIYLYVCVYTCIFVYIFIYTYRVYSVYYHVLSLSYFDFDYDFSHCQYYHSIICKYSYMSMFPLNTFNILQVKAHKGLFMSKSKMLFQVLPAIFVMTWREGICWTIQFPREFISQQRVLKEASKETWSSTKIVLGSLGVVSCFKVSCNQTALLVIAGTVVNIPWDFRSHLWICDKMRPRLSKQNKCISKIGSFDIWSLCTSWKSVPSQPKLPDQDVKCGIFHVEFGTWFSFSDSHQVQYRIHTFQWIIKKEPTWRWYIPIFN